MIAVVRKWPLRCQNGITEMTHLHKNARAKIPGNLIMIDKLLILCLFESRHSQVSKTVFILKFGPPVAKIIKFKF